MQTLTRITENPIIRSSMRMTVLLCSAKMNHASVNRLAVCFLVGLLNTGHAKPIIGVQVQLLDAWREAPPRFIQPGVLTSSGFMGTIRFASELTAEEVQSWSERGIRFSQLTGRADHIGSTYSAHIEWEALDALKYSNRVIQVEAEPIIPLIAPLEVTRRLIEAPAAAGQARLQGDGAGAGQIIVDIDSGIDPFHPSLFKADGGVYRWIDVDGDSALTIGVDTIDMNGDGTAETTETIQLLESSLINWGENSDAPNGQFKTQEDWLFLDLNGNNRRDFGPDHGYDDTWPAFGEPVFLVDDANGNGRLDLDERLFRLGTSKIVGALIEGVTYLRDDNLTELTVSQPVNGQIEESHGHAVAGILVAGTPGFTRYLGVVPDAEVIMVGSRSNSTPSGNNPEEQYSTTISALAWARDLGADIALFEFSSWGNTAMDGTSNLEVALDELHWNDRVSNVCPAGNLADSGKHTEGDALPEGTDVVFRVPETWYGDYPFQTEFVSFSAYWKGVDNAVSIVVEAPNAPAVTVSYGTGFSLGDYFGQCASNVSSANMVQVSCYFYSDNAPLPAGDYRMILSSNVGGAVPFHAYLNDAISGWSRGAEFLSSTTTSTICHPATANTAITVGAYGGRFGAPAEIGALRGYSSRGPRIDGDRCMDITAPDDPYAPLPTVPAGAYWPNSPEIQGGFQVFGGTSGAGPHVAGAVALMRQLNPTWPPARVKQELQQRALAESTMGEVPNVGWGFGKVSAYFASIGTNWTGNKPPIAKAELQERTGFEATLTAVGSTDEDDDTDVLRARWDWDYDGIWDTEYGDLTITHTFITEDNAPSRATVRMEIIDPKGFSDIAIVSFDVLDDAPARITDDPATGPDPTGVSNDTSDSSTSLPGRTSSITSSEGCTSSSGQHSTGIIVVMLGTLLVFGLRHPKRS